MELSLAWDSESFKMLQIFIYLHLQESTSVIRSGENSRVGYANVSDTFCDFFHAVFVNMGILV